MAYEQKPGTGSALKNTRKQDDRHADYAGTYKDANGNDHWFNLWVKKDKNGNDYFSFTIKPK